VGVINRNITRSVLNTTEKTALTSNINADALAFNIQTTDSFYIGYQKKFTTRFFQIGTANATASVVSVTYWDGTDWTAVDDLIDQTSLSGVAFAQSGFISWINKNDWQVKSLTGTDADLELYWVKITVSVNLHASTTLQSVINLFSDDSLLRVYYLELVTDTRYLPDSRTNFIEQHLAAKDLVVLRLQQMKAIQDENQVVDINEVCIAAVHACAYIILNAIAVDEFSRLRAQKVFDSFVTELSQAAQSFDLDDSGVIELDEEKIDSIFIGRW
jgi:hypothetical protein